jgi:glycosyltransferase involved in cell wall biosynthesis
MSLKILFVIDGLGHGGAERSLGEMLKGLTSAGIQSTVAFFEQQQGDLAPLFRNHGAELHFIPERGMLQRVAAVRRLIRAERPDVLHTALFESDVIGRLASIGQNIVVVSSLVNTPYDPIRHENPDINSLKLSGVRMIDAFTARHFTTHFHAVSHIARQAAIDALHVRPERITVIERGRSTQFDVPTSERRATIRQRLGLHGSDEVILQVGRQVYQKGQQFLLRAMTGVATARPHAVLLVAGSEGPQSDLLEQIRRERRLEGRVRLLGHRDDVADLMAAADLFAFPSLYEGAAGALLEAMAMGLPIVASRIPAIEEIVEERRNAFLVERATVQPLTKAIIDLLADKQRARAFGRRSREIFEERFTLDRCTARMVDFYRQLVARRPSVIVSDPAPCR